MAHFIVSFHARQADERIELDAPGTFDSVSEHHIYGEVHNYRYNVSNREADEFELACERLDAVAMYQYVEPEPLNTNRMKRIARLAGVSTATVNEFAHADWSESDHREVLAQSSDAEIASWIRSCMR
jgi:hypothetical protein